MMTAGPRWRKLAIGVSVVSLCGGVGVLVATGSFASGANTLSQNSSLLRSGDAAQSAPSAPSTSIVVAAFISFAQAQTPGGSGQVSNVRYVESSNAANVIGTISGDSSGATADPVIALEASGNFVANSAHVPPGAALPTGTVVTEIVDANTGQVEVWGVSNNASDLSQFGTLETASS